MPLFDDTRSDWGARPAKHRPTIVSPASRKGRMWHYNGPAMRLAGRPHSACLNAVLADQRFHQNTRGWNDVGYNGLVCPHGRAIEGRGIDAVGAHCAGYNTEWYGFQFMLGEGEKPTAAQWARASRLAADAQARSGHSLRDLPHSAGFATSCPGPDITRWTKGPVMGSASDTGPSPTSSGASGGVTLQEDDMPSPEDLVNADIIPDPDGSKTNPTWSMGTYFPATYRNARGSFRNTEEIKTQLAALTAAVQALATTKGVDPKVIADEVAAAVKARLAQLAVVDNQPEV